MRNLLALLLFLVAPLAAQTRDSTVCRACVPVVQPGRVDSTPRTVTVPVTVWDRTATPGTITYRDSVVTVTDVVVPPKPPTGTYPNRPATYTRVVATSDFTAPVPGCSGNPERMVAGTPWSVIYDCDGGTSNWSKVTEDGRSAWRMRQPAGSWSDGHGTGNVGVALANLTQVYLSLWVKWDPQYESHPISTKFVEFEGPGNVLLQYRHDNNFLRSASEAIGQAYEPQNGAEPTKGVWHQLEAVYVTGSKGSVRIWLDGQIRTSYTGVPVVGPFTAFKIVGHLGGGGMTKVRDSFYWIDQVLLATP